MGASSIPGRRGYSTGMGDRLRAGTPPHCFAKPPRPTEPINYTFPNRNSEVKIVDVTWQHIDSIAMTGLFQDA